MAAVRAYLAWRFKSSDFNRLLSMLDTLVAEHLLESVVWQVGDLSSPDFLHCIQVQVFKAEHVKLALFDQFCCQLVKKILSLISNMLMDSCHLYSLFLFVLASFFLLWELSLLPSQFVKSLLKILWRIDLLSVAEIQEMLQAEVNPKTVLFWNLFGEFWTLPVRMDDEADEILSRRVLWNGCCSDLPFLDSPAQNKLQPVVTRLRLDELRNLDFLGFEVDLGVRWNLKRLMVVKFGLELRKSALMPEESLEGLVEMRDRILQWLWIDFLQPRLLFFEFPVVARVENRNPAQMLLCLGVFPGVIFQCPVVDETNRPEMLVQKHLLIFCRV